MSKLPELSTIDVTPLVDEGTNLVTSYEENSISVNKVKYSKSIILTLKEIQNYENPKSALDDIEDDFNSIIIFGCDDENKRSIFKNLTKTCPLNQTVFEYMKIGPACRTYNVLATEARKVTLIIEF